MQLITGSCIRSFHWSSEAEYSCQCNCSSCDSSCSCLAVWFGSFCTELYHRAGMIDGTARKASRSWSYYSWLGRSMCYNLSAFSNDPSLREWTFSWLVCKSWAPQCLSWARLLMNAQFYTHHALGFHVGDMPWNLCSANCTCDISLNRNTCLNPDCIESDFPR